MVQCVIGNHINLEEICSRFDIPFHFVSHESYEKAGFESALISFIQKYTPDYLVLAKFMCILSTEFLEQFSQQIINIHHSFLPVFVGARPNKQAYERDVKLIGVKAHYVTKQLNEGPIIAQQIIPVTHSYYIGRNGSFRQRNLNCRTCQSIATGNGRPCINL